MLPNLVWLMASFDFHTVSESHALRAVGCKHLLLLQPENSRTKRTRDPPLVSVLESGSERNPITWFPQIRNTTRGQSTCPNSSPKMSRRRWKKWVWTVLRIWTNSNKRISMVTMILVWSLPKEQERLRLLFWSHLEEHPVWSDTKIPIPMPCSGSPSTTTTAPTTLRILDCSSRCSQFHRKKKLMPIRFISSEPNPFKTGQSGMQSTETAQTCSWTVREDSKRRLEQHYFLECTTIIRIRRVVWKTNYSEFDTKTKNRNKHYFIALFQDSDYRVIVTNYIARFSTCLGRLRDSRCFCWFSSASFFSSSVIHVDGAW